MLRRRPCALAISTARSTAPRAPLTTAWPGALSLPTSQTPSAAASAAIASTAARSRPSTAAMAPSPTGTAACMAWPRSRSRRAASPIERLPAAASAEYSPSEWPATNRQSSATVPAARALERAQRRDRGRHQGGLGVLGQAQPLVGPFEDQAAQRLAQRRVDLLEHRSGRRHRGEQGLAHADRLRALAREDQCCVHATPPKFRAALLSACAGPVKAQIPRGGPAAPRWNLALAVHRFFCIVRPVLGSSRSADRDRRAASTRVSRPSVCAFFA